MILLLDIFLCWFYILRDFGKIFLILLIEVLFCNNGNTKREDALLPATGGQATYPATGPYYHSNIPQ